MENILFKKSYLHKSFRSTYFDDLWNKKGVFTTIRVTGNPRRFLFMKEHLINLNKSLKKLSIDIQIDQFFLNNIVYPLFKKNTYYDHLFRIAVTNKKISLSLRKRIKTKKNFNGILVDYKRFNWKLKHLQYNKILFFLKKINSQSEEIILTKNNLILEGATTNTIFIKNNTIYIPNNGYYPGITLKFFLKNSKRKIIKKNIIKKQIQEYDEILLVGSGKGIVSLDRISQIHWHKRRNTVYNEMHKTYKSYIKSQIAT
tara:strand:+ start:7168 stop:7938 length:771 start_codon:yes stop_codon:yes gene_type:complete